MLALNQQSAHLCQGRTWIRQRGNPYIEYTNFPLDLMTDLMFCLVTFTIMATQSDDPTQSSPSANIANIYTTEADEIIVNELLAFVSDNINSLPYDMIIKLFSDFYSEDDNVSAKSILFQTVFNNRDAPRFIKRKEKIRNLFFNVQAILNISLDIPSQSVAYYIAEELSRLPPFSMICFDVSSLIKYMESVKLHLLILQLRIARNLDKGANRYVPKSLRANCGVHLNSFHLNTILPALLRDLV